MELADRRILVTGATGAIGSAVVGACRAAGASVRTLQRHPVRSPDPLVDVIVGDITQPETLTPAMAGVDGVVHLAGLLHLTDPTPAEQARYALVNDQGTAHVAAACAAAGVRRLVYASTIAVYGATHPLQPALDEDAPVNPGTRYASTKLAGEAHVRAFRVDGAPSGVVLRLAAVYGADLKGNYVRLLRSLQRGVYVGVGNGRNRRTLAHETDVARAVVLALTHPDAGGRTFNVTDGSVHDMRAIVGAMAQALGRPSPSLTIPASLARAVAASAAFPFRLLGRRPPVSGDTIDKMIEDVAIDGTRLQQVLGFRPQFGLHEGWADVVARWRGRDRRSAA